MAAIGTVTLDLVNGVVFTPSTVAEVLAEAGADGHGLRMRAQAAPDSPLAVVHFCADASAYQTLVGNLQALISGTAVSVTTSSGTTYTSCDVLKVDEREPPRTVWDGTATAVRASLMVVVRKRA